MDIVIEFIGENTPKIFKDVDKISYFEGYIILYPKKIPNIETVPILGIFPKANILAVYQEKYLK